MADDDDGGTAIGQGDSLSNYVDNGPAAIGNGDSLVNYGEPAPPGMYDGFQDTWYLNPNTANSVASGGGGGGGPAPFNYVPNVTLINPNQSDPRAIAAQLLNAQFAEWENTFQPIEKSLLNEVSFNNPAVLKTALNKATTTASNTSNTMMGILRRQNASQGIAPTQTQDSSTKRILNLKTAENVASASNVARENVRAQDEQILLGTIPNYQVQRGTTTAG
jgi:hypothetical protein